MIAAVKHSEVFTLGEILMIDIKKVILFVILCGAFGHANDAFVDKFFVQEYHQAYPIFKEGAANNVNAIIVDHQQNIWAATKVGIFMLKTGENEWINYTPQGAAGPVFDLHVDKKGTIWIGAWNGIYKFVDGQLEKEEDITMPISALAEAKQGMVAFGPDGMWQKKDSKWQFIDLPYSAGVRAVIPDKINGLWIATIVGLYHHKQDGFTLYQNVDALITPYVEDIDYDTDGNLWVGSLGGITIYKEDKRVGQFTTEQGLPTPYIKSVEQAPDGKMWIGTTAGIARYDGKKWSIRHSRRWLLSDDVRDIAFDANGNAWIATSKGVSAIKRKMMTFAEKADYFQNILEKRHVREPGLVEKCRLTTPGEINSWEPRDDDNDGQYTSMYLAMEAFRYAVTKSERAKINAKRAFEALKFLQTVTETDGFFARTVIPSDWKQMADANRTFTDSEWAEYRVRDPRIKRVENRWRLSKDGKWLWKGDTSSDEVTGHMYGYLFYHDLVADKSERKRVSEHVCRIVDYIIDGSYVFKDIDGTHTRWAVWSPEKLNNDPDWRVERGINSLEMLSYLKLAYYMSGKERYQKSYKSLLYDYDYIENIKEVNTQNPGWRTHIDDELLALALPCLLMHETDPKLQNAYRDALEQWYDAVKEDCSPYFNFTYGVFRGNDPNFDCSIENLQETPLDLIRWRVDNSKREDLRLVRYPEMEHLQTNRLLPGSERCLMRWDKNPWNAVSGDGGRYESDGVFWLLPYWMGRYYGFISAPSK
jgi:streptogramin lyase